MTDWGSVQYDSAAELYDEVMEKGLVALGIEVEFTGIALLGEVKQAMLADFNRGREEAEDPRDREFDNRFRQDIAGADCAEDLFVACRRASWDLWSAAPFIAELYFRNLKVKVPEQEVAATTGPWLNELIQREEGPSTGLACALLVTYGIVHHPDCFVGFDT